MPVEVDCARLVQNSDAGRLQAVAELEIFMSVAGEALVEPADAVEIGLPRRGVARQKVEPGEPLAAARVERTTQLRMVAQPLVFLE